MAKNENDDESLSIELTEEEKLQLEKEAKAEVMKALKAAKKAQFKESAKRRIQAEHMFRNGKDDSGEDLATIALQLASYPKWIMLDGAVYHSGRSYTKKRSVISVLADQMDRGWRQEAARKGERIEEMMPVRSILPRNLNYAH